MGLITNAAFLSTEEELIWIDYIGNIAIRTYNLFKPAIVKNNTEIRFQLDSGSIYHIQGLGHFGGQVLTICTHNILRTAYAYGDRMQILINTITINAVIHELFHADQYIESRIDVEDASMIEDATYDLTLRFISQHYDYICSNIGPIDLDHLRHQIESRNLILYNGSNPPYGYKDYERITPQLMIDNTLRYIMSEETFEKYLKLSPLTKPDIGINLVGSEYMKDLVWVKKNNKYDIAVIRSLQRACLDFMTVGSEKTFSEELYYNDSGIMFIFKLIYQRYEPVTFKGRE